MFTGIDTEIEEKEEVAWRELWKRLETLNANVLSLKKKLETTESPYEQKKLRFHLRSLDVPLRRVRKEITRLMD